MQNGSIIRSTRSNGPDVWDFRWREAGPDGKRKHRRIVIGPITQFPDRSSALLAIAHEWGTFTAIAGKDGRAVEWLPLGLPRFPPSTDLPQFVEHINNVNFKLGLRGTIRMETPVLYFYSPRDLTVSAKVSFAQGLITEWYPHADRVQPAGVITDTSLSQLSVDGSIGWNQVDVSPNLAGEFPTEVQPNRYYAARQTASSPLRVQASGGSSEKNSFFIEEFPPAHCRFPPG